MSETASFIQITNATKKYFARGQVFTAFEKITFGVERGEFVCILGASGCGKSTLLNAIAGFDPVSSGSATIDGVEVVKPSTKNVMIFQNYGLLPWRNALKNVELGLESKGLKKRERREIAERCLDLVGLSAFKKSYPRQLSGGMQQRVSIARALAVDPDVIFMDEPFAALDAMTRSRLQDEVRELTERSRKTIIFVTHDVGEAVYLADRIVILTPNPGRVKCVVRSPLRGKRERMSAEFLEFQNKIFELFYKKAEDAVEYYI